MSRPANTRVLSLCFVLVVSAATGAYAQAPGADRVGVRGFALFDQTSMTAADTFEATIESSTISARGGGVEALRLWRGLFARFAYATTTRTGERVFVFNREVFRLGIPLRIEIAPMELAGGWRADLGRSGLIGVYGGAGLLRVAFRQSSDFAQPDEDVDETFNGSVMFGGIDLTVARWIVVGAEAQYRRVPDAFGDTGAAAAFGESDLGGTTVRVLVGIRH